MKAILATGVAAAALTAAMSMPASAECVNGYETLGNNVIVLCETGPNQFGAFADDGMIPEDQVVESDEPLFTGSIEPMEEPDQFADDTFAEAPISTAAGAAEELVEAPIEAAAVATEELVEAPIEAAAVATEELVEAPIEAAAVATEELVEEPIEAVTFGEPMLAASTAAAEENEVPGQIPDEPFFATEVVMATSIDECRPGLFWMADEVPMACPQAQ
jgi:hypothetical protein